MNVCSVEGCEYKVRARGMCADHYYLLWRKPLLCGCLDPTPRSEECIAADLVGQLEAMWRQFPEEFVK